MLPLNASQIPKLFQDARALEAAGHAAQARDRYETILTIDARNAAAQFQLGQLDYKAGQLTAAADRFDKAAALAPAQPAIWKLYAQTLQKLGDTDRSAAFLKKAKRARVDPRLMVAFQDALGATRARSRTSIGAAPPDKVRHAISLLQGGQAKAAVQAATSLRRAYPDVAIIADILGNALAATGQLDAAEAEFRAAVSLDSGYAEAHANYGRFLVERGKPDAAIPILKTALKIAPGMANAWSALGLAYLRGPRRPDLGVAAFRKALKADPNHLKSLQELTRLLVAERQQEEAIELAERGLAAGGDEIDLRLSLARALSDSGRETEALTQIDKVLTLDPKCGPAYAARAAVLQTLGRFEEARAVFRDAIALMPKNGEAYRVFLLSERLAADDPLIDQMKAVHDDPDLPDMDRAHLGFALAKALEDGRRYDQVFTYLRPANDLVRKHYPYDIQERRDLVDGVRAAWAGTDLATRRIADAPDTGPIFVTGIPRSGTTLVEQIIASHSRVSGGGELDYARQEVMNVCRAPDGRMIPAQDIPDTDLAAAGHAAMGRLRAKFPDADIVTDKGVQSYTLIGPLRLALPHARIVVVRRDPRDNLLSIYRNMFAEGMHLYSYALKDLAAYYRLFEEVVAFWRDTAPGTFHEIRYEDLIADPEGQARALIDACGLEWEDGCLRFHENRRRVDTLSVHQVRQPIYKSSVKAWDRYRDELGELFDALGPDWAPEAG